jgi:hypothetical protein
VNMLKDFSPISKANDNVNRIAFLIGWQSLKIVEENIHRSAVILRVQRNGSIISFLVFASPN